MEELSALGHNVKVTLWQRKKEYIVYQAETQGVKIWRFFSSFLYKIYIFFIQRLTAKTLKMAKMIIWKLYHKKNIRVLKAMLIWL